ncbi:uncharacterized protein LODBEIA_P40050 [Lodderomyces beijingensis]|uniref:RNA helicase n=1 Tax=Lodderomyces beijingensis TaxID=1775926 RepID=A0ABP0ZS63_9ASCO
MNGNGNGNGHTISEQSPSSPPPPPNANLQFEEIYDQFLNHIRIHLLDFPPETITSAVDTLLEILGSQINVYTKRKEINELLNIKISDDELSSLIQLAVAHGAYLQKHKSAMANGEETRDQVVAVDVDEMDEDEEEGEYVREIIESASASESEGENENDNEAVVAKRRRIEDGVYDWRTFASDTSGLGVDSSGELYKIINDRDLSEAQRRQQLSKLTSDDSLAEKWIQNRWRIVFTKKLQDNEPKCQILKEMYHLRLYDLAAELLFGNVETDHLIKQLQKRTFYEEKASDLKIVLPKGTFQEKLPNYDIITVPAPTATTTAQDDLLPTATLPPWAREAFPTNETTSFNRIQSKIYPMAFETDENLLICAPTGAGKTNVAMLAMLRTISNHQQDGHINKNQFKIVYIAPLKALVQEQMREFQRRLTPVFGLVVNELTGDSSLSQQQIQETNVIVTTPEKWDIITRRNHDYLKLVKLMIIDEIHLLHDQRGPVLESIVSRVNRKNDHDDNDQEKDEYKKEVVPEAVRIVGLSATLPNYHDVAKFIRAEERGVFYFDQTYRPCPLEQKFVAIKEQKALKKKIAINEACHDQTYKCLKSNQQLIIFVHSRNETANTAEYLIDKFADSDLDIITEDSTREILAQESARVTNAKLQRILSSGIGVHHAGLTKDERTLVEDLFAQGHLKALVSTATLAWGVNLPAHTVIIKGTEVYSPESGSWIQLSPQDVFQMLGRAGRPRYDTHGEGIIITTKDELQYYLAILNQQYPVESQLLGKLIDNLNAEVVSGAVRTIEQGIDWLGHTYLYVRMLQLPSLYLVGGPSQDDQAMFVKRAELVNAAFKVLNQHRLIEYENGQAKATELGKIASYHYISYNTISKFNKLLKPWNREGDVIQAFAHSDEFHFVPVRREEKLEISKLMEKCPIPIRESPVEPLAKINILLQTYVSRINLEGYALVADMIYIKQSADRILHALYELAILKKWSSLARYTLELSKSIKTRMWLSDSPLRQFGSLIPREIVRASESSHLPWSQYFHLTTEELAEVLNLKGGNAQLATKFINAFPKIDIVDYAVQPVSETFMRIKVEFKPSWNWIFEVHGKLETFEVILEDVNGVELLQYQQVVVREHDLNESHILEFYVEMGKPLAPNLLLSFISNKWVNCTWKTAIITDLILPKDRSYFTERNEDKMDVDVDVDVDEGKDKDKDKDTDLPPVFSSEVRQIICDDEHSSCFIGVNKSDEKTFTPDLAIAHHFKSFNSRVVYINPDKRVLEANLKRWSRLEQQQQQQHKVVKLSGDLKTDVRNYNRSSIILATPETFYALVKRWKTWKSFSSAGLLLLDDLHTIESHVMYEFMVIRIRLLQTQYMDKNPKLRLVGIAYPLLDVRDVCSWLSIGKSNIVNFPASIRQREIQDINLNIDDNEFLCSIPSFDKKSHQSVVVFVSSSSDAMKFARSLQFDAEVGEENKILAKVENAALKFALSKGVGLFLSEFSDLEQRIVLSLFNNKKVPVLIATKDSSQFAINADVVMIDKTQFYDGYEHRDVAYDLVTLYDMVGTCQEQKNQGRVFINASSGTINYYSSFINIGLMVESQLRAAMHEFFLAGIVDGLLSKKEECVDILTHSFFYRRLLSNPSYYHCKNTSSEGISEYLSIMIEDVFEELVRNEFVEEVGKIDNDDEEEKEDEEGTFEFSPLNKALIASHYNLAHETVNALGMMNEKSKLRETLHALANAIEFEKIPIRKGEETVLSDIGRRMPMKVGSVRTVTPSLKAFILIQAYISRVKLPLLLQHDLKQILELLVPRLLNACVDVAAGEGHLSAMLVMDLSQMITQRTWSIDNHLRQIPHFDNDAILKRSETLGVASVYDFMSLEDDERDQLLEMDEDDERLSDVANFVNSYPNVKLTYDIDSATTAKVDEPLTLHVTLERDEDMESLEVVSPLPFAKTENWWIVIGQAATNQLFAIKKCQGGKTEQSFDVEFTLPNAGEFELTCWAVCDSYLDADKEASFQITVT